MAKQYGLIKPDKTKLISRPSIFNSDSDSNSDQDKPTGISTLKKKERLAQQKAIAEDPTIYQYDELYDDMQSQRKESKLARKDLDKKPKYINKLLESAERRKRENERRIEREVQKEREKEGDMYRDKESFVTSAYRKKLEEMKELEEKEKREDYLEAIGDVKKQSDLSGFYRHLYAQQVNFDDDNVNKDKDEDLEEQPQEEKSECSKQNSSEADTSKPDTFKPKTSKRDETQLNSSKSDETTDENVHNLSPNTLKTQKPSHSNIKKRKYRQRDTSPTKSDQSEEETKLEHLPNNIDADSDFSIDSDSDSDDNSSPKPKPDPNSNLKSKPLSPDKDSEIKTNLKLGQNPEEQPAKEESESEPQKLSEAIDGVGGEIKEESSSEKQEEIVEPAPKKVKKDLWKKRTVGEAFDEALRRYYERKSARVQAVA